ECRRPYRDQRHHHRILGVPHGWVRRLERPPVGTAERELRAGLGQRARRGVETGEGELMVRGAWCVVSGVGLVAAALPAYSQSPTRPPGSSNIHVLAHLPLGRPFTIAGIEVEQDLARPYAYVSRKIGGI